MNGETVTRGAENTS